MAYESHIEHLVQKHTTLENAIFEEKQRPLPDNVRIAELKRQKLRIKDELNRLQDAH